MNVVYFPIYFYWIYLSFKAKSFGFFNASNPRIKNGGFAMESKKEIYNLIPKKYYPKTLFFNAFETFETVIRKVGKSNFRYPFIIKPDVGLQGLRVEKISNNKELKDYLKKVNHDFLIQKLAQYPLEIGVFYHRMPNKPDGEITGIVFKDFLIVKGNGKNTVKELLLQVPRFSIQLETLKKKHGSKLNKILPEGESLNLMPYENHARGVNLQMSVFG